jgi:WhiB family redox-sensing transcriptional regulator
LGWHAVSGDWRDRALCLGMDPELWFPVTGPSPRAKRVCVACPVRAECLAFALAIGAAGIWGGLTEKERRALPAARVRPCKGGCGEPARLPARFCSDDCRQAARRKVQADSQRRRAAA